MNFRFAEKEDAVLLGNLRIAMRQERETVPPPADSEKFLQENIAYFEKALADGSYIGIIAEENGEAAGNGGICLHHHPPSYSVPNGRTACLLNMYTRPEFRGRGVAGRILAMLMQKSAEFGCCKIYLNASDMGRPLYEKAGFVEVSGEMVYDL